MYTLDFLQDNWIPKGNYAYSDLVVCESEGYNIDSIMLNIYNLLQTYKCNTQSNDIALNEDIWDKLMSKEKSNNFGLAPHEYVANKVRYNYKSDLSFYNNTEINIEVSPGNFSKGIIRISDHPVNLNKWAENNDRYDFGISFVIEEKNKAIINNEIVNIEDRVLSIYEFTYIVNRKNISFLNQLILEILDLKDKKEFIPDNTLIRGQNATLVTNRIIEKINVAIKNAIKSVFS